MAQAYRALHVIVTPPIAKLIADYAASDICEQTIYCTKRREGFLDGWTECSGCEIECDEHPADDRYRWVPRCFVIAQLEEVMDIPEICEDCES